MDRRSDTTFFDLLSRSYRRLLGNDLVPAGMTVLEGAQWLYESAPFLLLAHNTEPDPIFVYGNQAAQRRFEYAWDELITLPSRLSAAAPDRNERAAFIERVTKDRYFRGYRGIRIAKSGRQFWIEDATLWQLYDDDGALHGLAAMIPTTADL